MTTEIIVMFLGIPLRIWRYLILNFEMDIISGNEMIIFLSYWGGFFYKGTAYEGREILKKFFFCTLSTYEFRCLNICAFVKIHRKFSRADGLETNPRTSRVKSERPTVWAIVASYYEKMRKLISLSGLRWLQPKMSKAFLLRLGFLNKLQRAVRYILSIMDAFFYCN